MMKVECFRNRFAVLLIFSLVAACAQLPKEIESKQANALLVEPAPEQIMQWPVDFFTSKDLGSYSFDFDADGFDTDGFGVDGFLGKLSSPAYCAMSRSNFSLQSLLCWQEHDNSEVLQEKGLKTIDFESIWLPDRGKYKLFYREFNNGYFYLSPKVRGLYLSIDSFEWPVLKDY